MLTKHTTAHALPISPPHLHGFKPIKPCGPAVDSEKGVRLEVYWDGDDAWFSGQVRSYSVAKGHLIKYTDGERR